MPQDSLFPDPKALHSKLLLKPKDFESLFSGYERLRCVSYVVGPDLLLELYERFGLKQIEVVVGENLTDRYRRDLAQKGPDVVERLAARVADGSLRVLVPDRTLHTKLYLLERPGQFRVVQTSANLTETARRASRQVNYAWYADLPPGDPWLARVERDYEAHAAQATPFLGDLAELMRDSSAEKRRELVAAWLKTIPPEDLELETRKLVQELTRRAVEAAAQGAERVFSVRLPEAPAARRELERLLAPLKPDWSGGEARLSGSSFLRFVSATQGVPLLTVDRTARQVRLAGEDGVRVLTEPLPAAGELDRALAHLEAYLDTVDLGQAPDPRFAKTSMYEALLYLLAAPFAHELMSLRRSRYGAIDSRGPSFLYIYGPSQNGKSTFLRFALKLLGGKIYEPLNGGDFQKRKLLGAAAVGTAFPLAFDDLVLATRYALFEEVLKSYWEVWWSADTVFPQLVLTSNAYSLRDWAKSRVKRLDFDVQFAPSGAGKETLAGLFRAENKLFCWFSGLYFDELAAAGPLPEDELAFARAAFLKLYERAGRPLPAYFPAQPIETLYDPGRREWRDLLDRLRKARVSWEGDRAQVEFADDMQHFEIKAYENSLPQTIKHRRRGKTLVVETPKEFRAWLEDGAARGWWGRLLGRFG